MNCGTVARSRTAIRYGYLGVLLGVIHGISWVYLLEQPWGVKHPICWDITQTLVTKPITTGTAPPLTNEMSTDPQKLLCVKILANPSFFLGAIILAHSRHLLRLSD